MNDKPSEVEVIAYLYGELEGEEKLKLDRYFMEHPEEWQKVQRLQDTREVMSRVEEKEVIAPPVLMNEDSSTVSFWKSSWTRQVMAIAAGLVVVLVSARLLDLHISYSDQELRIGFGAQPSSGATLTAEQVQRMIDRSNEAEQSLIETQLSASQAKLDKTIQETLTSNGRQMQALANQVTAASQSQIREFVATLTRDQLTQMRDYVQLSAADQRKYADNLVTDFAKYLREQRTQDLNMYQTRFSRLEQTADEWKTETEQILASIISKGQKEQQNNY